MADLMVGGAFLSSFLNVLFDKLASPQVVNFIRGKKIDPKLLERMKTTLTVVRVVLDDAEKKQIKDPNVNNWLNDLKDAVYVADDLLDEISTKAATQKEVTNPFSFSRFFNVQDREMATKLEDIVERLESILKLKESLNLKEISVDNFSYKNLSTSLLDGKRVYGRDEDKEAIIKLLHDSNDCDEVSVISIVGMGGVGKTTLAQLVYNEDLKFNFKVWACVSEEFDIMRVTKIVTQAVTGKSCDLDDLNLLHLDLQGKLKDKKFLIVLDDVWIEDYVNWELLMRPFQRGVRGSKILVTTRSEKVASVVQTSHTYNLKKLSSDDCWLVFTNHACFSPGLSANSMVLEKIGREIVEKCKGLPLAAQSLGGILRRKHDVKDWDNLLKSDIWELSEHESKIIPSLRVSYHYLPPNLKRCFVYCSLFPKDYEFKKNDLIFLWMAEDLLSPPSKGKTLEEVGYEYFDDLVARSFLQCSNDSWMETWMETFVMHDLLHDLATFLGGEFYFRSEQPGEESKISSKTRHLAFTISCGLLENINIFETVKFLRTFLPSGVLNNKTGILLLMSKLKQLRVFSLSSFWGLDALPDSIGELIHLRYLDLSQTTIKKLPQSLCNLYNLQTLKLSYCKNLTVLPNGMENLTNLLYLDISITSITELPESLCELYNLQTLKLYDCKRLTMLPSEMQNLLNLRHLDIHGTPLKEMPKGMGKLTRLQNLSNYIVGLHEENGIQELGGLSNLHNRLSIENLENVSNGSNALEAKIMDNKYIDELKLIWSPVDCCADSQTEMDILSSLRPHQDLQKLHIRGYMGTCFPDWVGNSSYHNMTVLSLSSCKNCWMLPSLGQLPSLKYLYIFNMDILLTIDSSFYGNTTDSSMLTPFPSLEFLQFHDMPCWEIWSAESYAFPKLNVLYISSCPKLRDWPSHLHVLKQLTIQNSLNSLTCYQLDTLPYLEILTVMCCENLESHSVSPNWSLPKLQSLSIHKCPNFISFPDEGLHAPIMTSFRVSNCNKLKSLPQQMNTLLPKLEQLCISNCPDIGSFPEGGMPPSLRSISITNCEKLLNSRAWPSMDMLTNVVLEGPCDGIKSFPKEGFLPSSLTCIEIHDFSSLETLDCKGLLHLTSLQQLVIINCAKLEKIAGEKLPVSLTQLFIRECPLLEEQCSLKDPQVWPKISHVSLSGPRFGSFRW